MKIPDPKDRIAVNAEEILNAENLILLKIPPHENSLYLSVAKALHYPITDFQKLYYKACNFLYRAISENVLFLFSNWTKSWRCSKGTSSSSASTACRRPTPNTTM